MPEYTSTGRGGAGNIGHDTNVYTAGDIVREGVEGVSADGEYSTGRGGAGNIGLGDSMVPDASDTTNSAPDHEHDGHRRLSAWLPGSRDVSRSRNASRSRSRSVQRSRQGSRIRTDEDVVPETATRTTHQENFHTGRGGQGNVHKDKYGGHTSAAEQARASTPGLGEKVESKLKHIFGRDGTPQRE